jgi:hypothetical protein
LATGRAIGVELVMGERSGSDIIAGVVTPHLLQGDTQGDQGAENRPGGRAHDDVEILGVDPEGSEGIECPDGPRTPEDPAPSED